MKCFCIIDGRAHDHTHWRFTEVKTQKGTKYGWICGKYFKPTQAEFVPERIKEDRNKYAKSLLQPYREGVPSKEYIKTYGTKRFNSRDLSKAREVWKDVLPRNWEKSI